MNQIIKVTSLHTDELKPYLERSEKQLLRMNEPNPGYFVAESQNVIIRALDGGYEPVSFLVKEGEEDTVEQVLQGRFGEVPVYVGEENLLKSIIGFELTRGMLCLMRRKLKVVIGPLMDLKRIVILEDVVNPTNLGAIFRSAAALGMDAVLLTHGCTDPLYRRAARVSMGTVFQVPWGWLPNGDDWLKFVQSNGYQTVSMALRHDSIDLDDPRLQEIDKLAVIMGTEGEGLREETILHSDYVVKIPMAHHVDSLNVAAASAVAFWQLGKR